MTRKITIQDIAKALNTTASTVSRALNDNPRISKATRERVKAYALEHNYQTNILASTLRKGKSKTVGVILPEMENQFHTSVVSHLERILFQLGFQLIVQQSGDSQALEKRIITKMLENRLCAIVLVAALESGNEGLYDDVIKQGIPLFFLERWPLNINSGNVLFDNYQIGFAGTEHLILQGCKKIALLTVSSELACYNEQIRGYKAALEKYKIPVNEDYIVFCAMSEKGAFEAMREFVGKKNIPNAVLAVNDYVALGAFSFFKSKRIRIPDEVAIIGFGNSSFTPLCDPSLSTIDIKKEKIAEYLAAQIAESYNAKPQEWQYQSKKFGVELIVRNSSLKKLTLF